MPPRRFSHCQRRTIPHRLKTEIILRQEARCADCATRLVMGSFVFDHRPPLAMRDVSADANDPDLIAAICTNCNKRKTPRDLEEIAHARRWGPTYSNVRLRQRSREVTLAVALPSDSVEPLLRGHRASTSRRTYNQAQSVQRLHQGGSDAALPAARIELHTQGHLHSCSPCEDVVRRAQERWDLEERGLGSWPPFSTMDLT